MRIGGFLTTDNEGSIHKSRYSHHERNIIKFVTLFITLYASGTTEMKFIMPFMFDYLKI